MRLGGFPLLFLAAAGLQAPFFCAAQQVRVNGHELFLQCEGKSIRRDRNSGRGRRRHNKNLEKVQTPVSAFAKVCSYDRAGLGKSTGAFRQAQSAEQIVYDLAALLKAAHLRAPYVVVGHSVGGIYSQGTGLARDAGRSC